jgi:NAD(P)-dependent dehydrogenase (short-subunit alcohol dehydrogenase family)
MEKKVVLITGATGGIGSEACKLFGQKGYAIAMNDCRKERGEAAVAKLAESGVEAAFFPADATREDEVNDLVKQILN